MGRGFIFISAFPSFFPLPEIHHIEIVRKSFSGKNEIKVRMKQINKEKGRKKEKTTDELFHHF